MPLAQTLTPLLSPVYLAALAPNSSVTVPLLLVCLGVLIVIPVAAARGKLHVPGYVGLAFLAFTLGFVLGRIVGIRSLAGTIAGLALSILFYLLMATAVGSVLALLFYRHPPEA